jgi:hypothetical protein
MKKLHRHLIAGRIGQNNRQLARIVGNKPKTEQPKQ